MPVYNRIMDFTENDRRYHSSAFYRLQFVFFFRFPYFHICNINKYSHNLHSYNVHEYKMIDENGIRRRHTTHQCNRMEYCNIIFAFINLWIFINDNDNDDDVDNIECDSYAMNSSTRWMFCNRFFSSWFSLIINSNPI